MEKDINTESTDGKPVESNDEEKTSEPSSTDDYESTKHPESSEKRRPLSPKNPESSEKPTTPESSENQSPGTTDPGTTSGNLKRKKTKSPESLERKRSVKRKITHEFEDQSTSNLVSQVHEGTLEVFSPLARRLRVLNGVRVLHYFSFLSSFLGNLNDDILSNIRRRSPRSRCFSLVPTICIDLFRVLRRVCASTYGVSIFTWLLLTILFSGVQLQLPFINIRTGRECAVPVHYLGGNMASIPLWNVSGEYFEVTLLNLRNGVVLNGTTPRLLLRSDERMLPLPLLPPRLTGRLMLIFPHPNRTLELRNFMDRLLQTVEERLRFFDDPDHIDQAALYYYYFRKC